MSLNRRLTPAMLVLALAACAPPAAAQMDFSPPPDTPPPRGGAYDTLREALGCDAHPDAAGAEIAVLEPEAAHAIVHSLYDLYEFYAAEAGPRFELSRMETFSAEEASSRAPVTPTLGDGMGIAGALSQQSFERMGSARVRQAWVPAEWQPLPASPPFPVDLFEMAGENDVDEPVAFTTYRVLAELAGQSREYDAAAAWYRCAGGGLGMAPLDFVTDGLESVAELTHPRPDVIAAKPETRPPHD